LVPGEVVDKGNGVLFFCLFVAGNCRILHPTKEDEASGQIWHFATMPGAKHITDNGMVARWHIFKPKIPIWLILEGITMEFVGIFYGLLVYL
jgi:hypothetical protein